MKPLTSEECWAWCADVGLNVARTAKPVFSTGEPACFSVRFPDGGRGRGSLAVAMLNDDVEHPIPFTQALLWTHLWGIGSEELDQMGVAALEGMRGRPLTTHPGLLFEPTECSAAQASWAVTMIFEFDASLVLASGDFVLYASHDSELYVACRSAELRDGIAREYAEFWPVRIGDCPVHMR